MRIVRAEVAYTDQLRTFSCYFFGDTMTTDPTPKPTTPEIQVDSDWKAEAQAEKDRLIAAEEKADEKAETREIPEANFRGLLGTLASQALMGLGMHQDPSGNGVMVDLEGSKFTIDLLEMLVEKTQGNLSEEESTELKQLTQELQNRFVQIAQLVAAQMQEGAQAPAAQTPSGIIDPTA
ncbi:MAG TPA: DUF1844 domain-containing protein [Phycisphaerales bacterium]|nr:DUF1844 domain-containing protein [Phycisphaerales bacterium]HIN84285.1 DUF1844 domain-containing protein [Phycisphaerales bacterium]HIO53068.1 DUF1844 domain-containing protein [Phycisphaerales bacterium]